MEQNKKKATSFRLSDNARQLLNKIANSLGISKTAVIELAIRKYAKKLKGDF